MTLLTAPLYNRITRDFLPQRTIQYKTFVKKTLKFALQDSFRNHPDKLLQKTKVTNEYPRTQADYPTIIIRFFEREVTNVGVGHKEMLTDTITGQSFQFEHSIYTGDIEFAIYALSSYDRDLIADTITHILRFGDLQAWTNRFFAQAYIDNEAGNNIHVLTLNTDQIQGFGENQANVMWGQEDAMIYTTSYRVRLFGEFYSPEPNVPLEFITKILLYPYIADLEPVPTGLSNDDNPWLG